MKPVAVLVCACCALFGAAGCRNDRPVHLKLDGLGAATEGKSIVSLAAGKDALVIKGDGFQIRVTPWVTHVPFAGGEGYVLTARTEYMPDGPSAVLELGDQSGAALIIGYRVRRNASVLPGYRLHPGKILEYVAENGRRWTNVSLEQPDGSRTRVVPGRTVTLAGEGRAWTLVVPGASIRDPGAVTPGISREEPDFIADYVLWSRE